MHAFRRLKDEQFLSTVESRSEWAVAAVAGGVAGGGRPRVFHAGYGQGAGCVGDHRPVRARGSRLSAVSPAKDGHAAAVRLRHGGVFVASHPEAVRAGRGLPGDGGRGRAQLSHDQRLSQAAPEGDGGVVCAGAAAEDDRHGGEARGDELPAELARRESRLAKIQEAKKALEQRALEAAQAEEARRQTEDDARRAAGETVRSRRPVDPTPDPKAQRNFTDPESKIMKGANLVLGLEGKGFDPCGNAPIVCHEEPIMVAAEVTDQGNDKQQVQPMASRAQENLPAAGVEETIAALHADAGYSSEENVSSVEGEHLDPYIATQRLK